MTFTTTPTATASAATRWGGPAALGLALMAALGVTALLSSGTNISSTFVAPSSTKLARGANTTAMALPASDKTEHTQCLANVLETEDGVYEGAVKTFLQSQGQNYTKGGHFGLLQAYKASTTENSLDDDKYRSVATAKARVDGLVGYIMHLRTADACDKTNDDLAAKELLYAAIDEGKCMKSKAAIDAFKSNEEGKALIALCETAPLPTFTVKEGDPCTLAENDHCVGRPGGYLKNEHCDIHVVGGGGTLGPCPVFDTHVFDILALPDGAEYSGWSTATVGQRSAPRCPAGVALAAGDALSWNSNGNRQGSGTGEYSPNDSYSSEGGGWQICFA